MRPAPRLLALLFAVALATLALAVAGELGLDLPGIGGGALAPRDAMAGLWLVAVLLVALDWLVSPGARGTDVALHAPAESFVGEPVPLRLRFEARRRPPGPVTVRVDLPERLRGPSDAVLAPGEGEVELAPLARERGRAAIERVDAMWRSRLGLLEFVPRYRVDATVALVPNIRAVRSGSVDIAVREALFGEKQTAFRGEGSEFHQLSEFAFGMDTRAIDWKSSARHRSLMVREMRAERNHPVVIALDNGHLMRERIPDSDAATSASPDGEPNADDGGVARIDHVIRAALALAWGVVQAGDLVGLYAFDARPREWMPPSGGRAAFAALRARVAGLEYRSVQSNHTLALSTLSARLGRRTLVVVFCDFVDTTTAELLVENVAVLRKEHVVVFVLLTDPSVQRVAEAPAETLAEVARAVAAARMLEERQGVIARLHGLGVEVVEALPGQLVSQVLKSYLRMKQAGTV